MLYTTSFLFSLHPHRPKAVSLGCSLEGKSSLWNLTASHSARQLQAGQPSQSIMLSYGFYNTQKLITILQLSRQLLLILCKMWGITYERAQYSKTSNRCVRTGCLAETDQWSYHCTCSLMPDERPLRLWYKQCCCRENMHVKFERNVSVSWLGILCLQEMPVDRQLG